MRFADPALLALLALIPVYIWLLRRAWRRPRPALALPRLDAPRAAHGWRARTLPYLPALRVIAATLLIVAIARPQRAHVEAAALAEGIDIVLTIDTSSSMERNNLSPEETRLTAARRVAREFLSERAQDRVGVVIFQAESLVLSPLTLDLEAVDTLMETSVRSGLLQDGTALGLALADSVDLLRDSDAASRIVVALTDGEDNITTVTPGQAAALAKALGIHVYTIGLTHPDERSGLHELSLAYVARETGGNYFRATDPAQLREAYAQIAALERARVGEERFRRFDDLAPWLIIPALGLILAELGAHASGWRRAP